MLELALLPVSDGCEKGAATLLVVAPLVQTFANMPD